MLLKNRKAMRNIVIIALLLACGSRAGNAGNLKEFDLNGKRKYEYERQG